VGLRDFVKTLKKQLMNFSFELLDIA